MVEEVFDEEQFWEDMISRGFADVNRWGAKGMNSYVDAKLIYQAGLERGEKCQQQKNK